MERLFEQIGSEPLTEFEKQLLKEKEIWINRAGCFMEENKRLKQQLKYYEDAGLAPERCAELAQAEAKGRLVAVPEGHSEAIKLFSADMAGYERQRVILPHEEAEAALKGENQLQEEYNNETNTRKL